MRMRKKKNLAPRMERCEDCWIREPKALRGNWKSLYPEAKELHVEIGCGKGRFTAEMAKTHPDILFVAIERVLDAMVVAMERVEKAELRNVYFIGVDARQLPEIFEKEEVDSIYLNFSDPWPGTRHAKRRLTHHNFLLLYREVLKSGGTIQIKTDNVPLFDFSLTEIPQYGFTLSELTRDLHKDGPVGVMTDYEQKFYEQGLPINRCVATMIPWEIPAELAEHRVKDVKITVMRIAQYDDLSAQYENPIEHTCDLRLGQSFIAPKGECPDGFCDSAWGSMEYFVRELAHGRGDFYDGWMKNPNSAMISCNDGFRPVSFYLETIE